MNFVEANWEEVRKKHGIDKITYNEKSKYKKLLTAFVFSEMDMAEVIFDEDCYDDSNGKYNYDYHRGEKVIARIISAKKANIKRAIKIHGFEDVVGVFGSYTETNGKIYLFRTDRDEVKIG